MRAAEKDQLISEHPEWQRETILKVREILKSDADFTELPDRFEINEYQMMEDFCLSLKNRRVGDELRRLIKGGGAFRRFKNAVNSMELTRPGMRFGKESLTGSQLSGWRKKESPTRVRMKVKS